MNDPSAGDVKQLKLIRDIRLEIATIGQLIDEETPFQRPLLTIERPWKGNQRTISCIPQGIYLCERDMYYGGDGVGGDAQDYECFELRDVPGRTEIKIHIANYVRNVVGCIGLGLTRDLNVPAVWSSAKAYRMFMEHLQGVDAFELEIVDA